MICSSFQGWLPCAALLGDCTAEARRARSKEFLINEFSELRELCASAVNSSSQETRNNHNELRIGLNARRKILPSTTSACGRGQRPRTKIFILPF